MPWYWTDDMAAVLLADGSISPKLAVVLMKTPVAHRSEHQAVEEAAHQLLDDGEIPLAA